MQAADNGVFIDVNRLDFKRYAARPAIAKVLADYLLYHEHNPRKALELAAEATVAVDYKDWWWKTRLGKCYYQLGLFRDAEKQFESSLRNQEMVITVLELCKVYLRLDQPNTALDRYDRARDKFPGDIHLLLGSARVQDMLNNVDRAVDKYKDLLQLDSSNIEAIACLASNFFYTDHPEVALRYYRRLLQMDVNNAELWCNIGLCCFYASQYDMTLSCLERALAMASDDTMADIWYNIGQVAIGIGDLGLAYQAFKIAVSVDSNHAESYNNLGVLELRKGNLDQARANFQLAESLADFMFEPSYNRGTYKYVGPFLYILWRWRLSTWHFSVCVRGGGCLDCFVFILALLAYKVGDFRDSYTKVNTALATYPAHSDSLELKKQLQHFLTMM
jgi:tetratricopeptide repeat protein 8